MTYPYRTRCRISVDQPAKLISSSGFGTQSSYEVREI